MTILALFFSISVNAQKITDTLIIKMDTSTYKILIDLIRENIDIKSATGKIVQNSILYPLSKFTFLQPADKPKPIK